jgi:7,8-dihydroneopterin aldolase/epimerase/oxygenase
LAASVRYDTLVEETANLAGQTKYRTLEALAEAVATGLLQRFTLIDGITVSVSKLSPPIPRTLSKVGITVRLARTELVTFVGQPELVRVS